jgi:hypothetical protein
MASTTLKAPFCDSEYCIIKSPMSGVLNLGIIKESNSHANVSA